MKYETIKIDELNMKKNINGIMVLIEKSWLIKKYFNAIIKLQTWINIGFHV